jgi:two-component system phosphate regulon sensor histidine kinase PhoR
MTYTAREIAVASIRSPRRSESDELSQLTLAFNSMSLQLQSQIAALKEERSKLTTVLQQMTDAVIIADEAGHVQLFNHAAENLFQISAEDAMGHSLAEVLRDHRLVDLWEKCRHSGVEESVYLEFRQLNLALQCIATPMESSEPDLIMLLFQNLTHIRRLETVRRDFISNISHELRTPLASLKALTETLQDGALDDPPAARRFLNRMEIEVDALSHMVSELLELSRIESGKVPLQLTAISPCKLLKPAYDRVGLQAERNQLQLSLECDPTLPAVLADAPRIQQVIANLLQNAIKFTPAGGEIKMTAYEQDSSIVFAIKDTGVGIPSEDLERIFERFYKSDRARSSSGTGLGLAISRHLVEAHGGIIWAESIETRGSTFFFTLLKA